MPDRFFPYFGAPVYLAPADVRMSFWIPQNDASHALSPTGERMGVAHISAEHISIITAGYQTVTDCFESESNHDTPALRLINPR